MKKLLNTLMKYRLTLVSLILCIFCWLFNYYGDDVVVIFGLQWRPWVLKTAFAAFCIFKCIFLGSLAVKFVKWCYAKYIIKPSFLKEIAAKLFGVLCLTFVFFMIGWELWALSGMPKEHMVIRDGKKCVACVTSWHGSSVYCYEYKGPFLMGDKTISYKEFTTMKKKFFAMLPFIIMPLFIPITGVIIPSVSTNIPSTEIAKIRVGSRNSDGLLPVNILDVKDAEYFVNLLDKAMWQNGTADCYNDCIFGLEDGSVLYYHSDCGTFNDNTNQKCLMLSQEDQTTVNNILAKYIILGSVEVPMEEN